MTQQEAVLDLLSYIGIYGFEADQDTNVVNGEDDSDVLRAITSLNAALQEMYRKGPLSLKFATRSTYFHAPTSVSLTMVSGQGGTSAAVLPSWMRGCSIQIEGDDVLNRVSDLSDLEDDAGTDVSLLRGYLGTSGVHLATVYGDAVLLDDDVAAVLEPVEIAPNQRLRPARGKIDFNAQRYYDQYVPFSQFEKQVGTPSTYLVEQKLGGVFPGGSLFLSLNPMPGAALNLTYDIYRKPETIVRGTALDEAGGDDPEMEFASVPPDMIDSILMPIARWKFFTHPNLRNNEARNSVKDAHDEALKTLQHGQTFTPQVAPTRVRYMGLR